MGSRIGGCLRIVRGGSARGYCTLWPADNCCTHLPLIEIVFLKHTAASY